MNVTPHAVSRRRVLAMTGVGLGTAATLSACGGSSSGGGGGDSDAKEITYWSNWNDGEPQQKVIAEAAKDFEKETGIKVKALWQGRQVTKKIAPVLNTANVPDLVDAGFGKLSPVLQATKKAADVADVYKMDVDGKTVEELVPEKIRGEQTLMDGQPWMVPYIVTSEAIWFNKAKHADLASNTPKTWAEFIKLLDGLKGAGESPIAIDGDVSGYNSMWFTTLYELRTGVGGFKKLASDKSGAMWDGAEAKEIAALVEQLVKGGYFISGYAASKFPAQQTAWANGKAALMLNGSWLPTETAEYAADGFEYDSFQMPMPEGAQGKMARADMVGFAIPKNAKGKKSAGKFAAFMLREKYQKAMATEAKQLPVLESVEVDPALKSVAEAINQADSVYMQNGGVEYAGYVPKIYWPIDDKFVKGEINADDFRAQMKDAQVTYWKQNG